MLTRISLALFTSATARPQEEGSMAMCQRHWGGTESRHMAGQLPREGCWPGIPYQILRKELVNERTLRWGEASKESLQECFCHRQKLQSFPLGPLWDESSAWPVLGRVKGSGGTSPRHKAKVWFTVGWGMTCAKRAQGHVGMDQLQERILHSSKLATGLNAFRDFFSIVLCFTGLHKLVPISEPWSPEKEDKVFH